MLIKNEFQVAAPPDKVWQYFGDIPQVAACLAGAAPAAPARAPEARNWTSSASIATAISWWVM